MLLKTFQRLGYFVAPTTIPSAIAKHIAHSAALACPPDVLRSYDTSGTRWRHIIIIRDYLSINLVSNCLIFYNVFENSRILQEYIQAGNTLEAEIIGALSPYLTKHINRFGSYSLDLNRKPPILDFGFSLIPS